ncbi:MAG: hypothetical protein R3Y59_05290 [bacterium]
MANNLFKIIKNIIFYRRDRKREAQRSLFQEQLTEKYRVSKRRIIFPKKYFSSPDENQIIFTAGNRPEDQAINQYIADNLEVVEKKFKARGYEFCYLPKILQEYSIYLEDSILYNNPDVDKNFIKNLVANISLDNDFDILDLTVDKEVDKKIAFHRFLDGIEEEDNELYISKSTFENDPGRRSAFIRYLEIDRDYKSNLIFSYFDLFQKPDNITFETLIETYISFLTPAICSGGFFFSLGDTNKETSADEQFNLESMILMDEIRERIKKLRENGVSEVILEALIKPTTTVSRLHITEDYKIFLTDYNNIEIKMTPLPKAVFFLFLRHKDGIIFKDLCDYRDELTEIYLKITHRSSIDDIKDSIAAITDPTNNSINEKCARIREAFVKQIHETHANNYYIQGFRASEKYIPLPSDKIDCDSDILTF